MGLKIGDAPEGIKDFKGEIPDCANITTTATAIPTISACLIVRNEEACLARCLESIMNVVDEIVVVDTGSTDNTVRIAEEHGAWVHHLEWQGDFAKARNFSLSKATRDWCLVIDADEEFEGHRGALEESLKMASGNIKGIKLPLVNILPGDRKVYIFPERLVRRGVKFEGAIHEHIPHDKGEPVGHLNHCRIIHHGYNLTEDQMRDKQERNLEILMKEYRKIKGSWMKTILQTGPSKQDTYRYLVKTLGVLQRNDEALAFAEEYLAAYGAPYVDRDTIYNAFQLCIMKGDGEGASRWLHVGMEKGEPTLDLHYCAYQYGRALEDPNTIITAGREYIKAYQRISKEGMTPYNIGHVAYTYNPQHYGEVCANTITAMINEGLELAVTLAGPLRQAPAEARGKIISYLQGFFNKLSVESNRAKQGKKRGRKKA
jgi:glycosyltransferase involved in cell wall biosynthesis